MLLTNGLKYIFLRSWLLFYTRFNSCVINASLISNILGLLLLIDLAQYFNSKSESTEIYTAFITIPVGYIVSIVSQYCNIDTLLAKHHMNDGVLTCQSSFFRNKNERESHLKTQKPSSHMTITMWSKAQFNLLLYFKYTSYSLYFDHHLSI